MRVGNNISMCCCDSVSRMKLPSPGLVEDQGVLYTQTTTTVTGIALKRCDCSLKVVALASCRLVDSQQVTQQYFSMLMERTPSAQC